MDAIRTIASLFKDAFDGWNADNAPRLAAALAYYIAFSLAPLLIIIVSIVGFVLQESVVREQVLETVTSTIGASAGSFVDELMVGLRQPQTGIISTILGIVALLLGALGAFEQLQSALNTVWNVPEDKRRVGIRGFFLNKLLSFGMILMIGFLLLVSLVLSTILGAVQTYTLSLWPGAEFLLRLMNLALSYAVITFLFAMIYRVLPDITLPWGDVLVGAFVTTVLFNVGKFALGLYLGNSGLTSAYGAAGSFVLIMLWIYYSAQIVLFGAEFTQVYAKRFGSLRDNAEPQLKANIPAKV